MGTVAVRGEGTIYQLSSAASSLTDLGDLPDIRTPEPFVARRKGMQTININAQMLYRSSLSRMSARLVSPWDFRFPSSSGGQSRDDHEKTVDILGLFVGVRGGGEGKEEEGVRMGGSVPERELSPPPFMGVGYAEGTGAGRIEVVSGPESRRTGEKPVITVTEGVWGGAEAEVNFPVNCASHGGRMSEELVLRSLTALVGWS